MAEHNITINTLTSKNSNEKVKNKLYLLFTKQRFGYNEFGLLHSPSKEIIAQSRDNVFLFIYQSFSLC